MDRFTHIAIDGPAGSGKTTVARALARELGVLYLDTGAMYRAVADLVLAAAVDPADAAATLALASARPIRAVRDAASDAGFAIYAGDRRLGDELYRPEVSRIVSLVAAHPAIRALMVERQRATAREGPVVMAGRDIGTVVLPDAPVKVFLTASLEERVGRRLAELAEHGVHTDRASLRREIEARDRLDRDRATAPLRAAPGAVVIDSSGVPVAEVVARIAGLARAAS